MMDPDVKARLVGILRPVSVRSEALGVTWLLVGAAARDVVLEQLSLKELDRATLDVDIAVQVRTWSEFSTLKCALMERDGFLGHALPHRLISPWKHPLDMVPFGELAKDGELAWEGSDGMTMDVALFDDVLKGSAVHHIDDMAIRIPSLAGLVSMKLTAWRDRHFDTRRDAVDLSGLLERTTEWISIDRLYGEHAEVVSLYDYDLDLACIHVLGHRIAGELSSKNRVAIQCILQNALVESGPTTLLRDLASLVRPIPFLQALLAGVQANLPR